MTTNTAASALSGAAAPAGATDPVSGGGDGGAGAVAAAAAAATAAASGGSPAPTGGTGGAPAPSSDWFSGIQDEGVRNWVQAKGFKDATQAAESAYNLEKLIGFDRAGRTIVVPDDKATAEQLAEYRSKIGVPETPDGYGIKPPDGESDAFAKQASQWMHEAGIPAKAGEALANKWGEYVKSVQAEADAAFHAKSDADFSALKTEWGQAFDQNMELAKRAASQFIPGSPEERAKAIDSIERAIGTGALLKMMSSIGQGLGEHKVHADGTGGFMTPAQASQRINELKSNADWTKAYLSGDQAKAKELQDLIAAANPQGG